MTETPSRRPGPGARLPDLATAPAGIVEMIVLAAVISLALAAPLATGGPALGDSTVDTYGTWWFQWWVDRSLGTGASLTHTDLLFHPWGKDILRDTGANLLDALLVVPVRRLLGPLAAWNTLYLLILTANGVAAGAWARALGGGRAIVLTVVAATALHPYPLYELAEGRPTQAMLFPLLGAIALAEQCFRADERGRGLRLAVASGVLLALTGWAYWFAAGFGAGAIALLAPGRPPLERALKLAVIALVAFALTAPAVIPLAGALSSGEIRGVLPVERWIAGDFALENGLGDRVTMCTLGPGFRAGYLSTGAWEARGVALGLSAAGATALAGLRDLRWWGICALALAVAVGPLPAGHTNPIYLVLVSVLPPMERLFWPCRALSLWVPASVVGLTVGLGWLARRHGPRALLLGAASALLALSVEAGLRRGLPLPTWSPGVEPAWSCLARQEGAVLVLPYGIDHKQLLHQTVHQRPIFGGMNERSRALVPLAQQTFRAENSWVAAMVMAGQNPRDRGAWTEADRAAMGTLGYRYAVLRVADLRALHQPRSWTLVHRALRARLKELAGEPVFSSEEIVVYAPWGHPLDCDPTVSHVPSSEIGNPPG